MGGAAPSSARSRHASSGHFDREIVGVDIPETHDAGGDVIAAHTVTRDDGPREGTTVEALAKLKPAFKPGGTVTAGNACPLNDGAAAVLVMSEEKARERGLKPRARIVASAVAAIRPEIMGLGPIPAIRTVLKAAGMTIDDIDLVEMNEAFAAQVLPCRDELGIDPDKLNINGGAIALGHPFGMTGARIMTTLLNNLDSVEGRYGLETMCVAGGIGAGDDRRAAHLRTERDSTMATTSSESQTAARGSTISPAGSRWSREVPVGSARRSATSSPPTARWSRPASPQISERADELRQSIEADGGTLSLHQGNIGDAEDCQRVVKEVIEQHGRLDILVNNAGITVDKPVWKMSPADWDKVLTVDLSGSLLHVQAGDRAHDRARLGADHQHLVGDRRDRQHRPGELHGLEVGRCSGSRRRSPARRRSRSGWPESSRKGSGSRSTASLRA